MELCYSQAGQNKGFMRKGRVVLEWGEIEGKRQHKRD
jgi:hypothetical protein